MTDETSDITTDSNRDDDLVDEAWELIDLSGIRQGQILYAGVELGVFAVADQTPTAASDIARELALDPDHTYRLLRALASIGVLDEHPDRRFSLTALGEVFQPEHPQSVSEPTSFYQSPEVVSAFTHLPAIVREGTRDGFDHEFGRPFYDYTEQNPEFADSYNRTMSRVTADETDAVLDALKAYDFSRFSHVCDVGGGHGHLLCHVLELHPHLEGTVFDLPSVVSEDAQHWAPTVGVKARCTYVGGDMFDSVPTADGYFLKHVLDNWSDGECVDILSTIHDAAPPDARVFVAEFLVGSEPADPLALVDIHQLVVLGGGVSTRAERANQLEQAGWEFVDLWVPQEGPLRVIEGRKA